MLEFESFLQMPSAPMSKVCVGKHLNIKIGVMVSVLVEPGLRIQKSTEEIGYVL